MKIELVPVDKINVGERFRRDMGDLESLAANIRDMGLLQPIAVDSYYKLICGYRRLRVCRSILKWETIPCVILDVKSILAGEYAENEFRKQFTPSERTSIVDAILRDEERRKPGPKSQPNGNCGAIAPQFLTQNYSGVDAEANRKMGRAADDAARQVGFTDRRTYQRAKAVVENGAIEVVQAMDSGEISIAAAAVIADQPKAEQSRIVAMPKDERRELIRQIRQEKHRHDEQAAHDRDIELFGRLNIAVEFIAGFYESPHETWAGLSRVNAISFASNCHKAIQCLVRIEKAHPNAPVRPEVLSRKNS